MKRVTIVFCSIICVAALACAPGREMGNDLIPDDRKFVWITQETVVRSVMTRIELSSLDQRIKEHVEGLALDGAWEKTKTKVGLILSNFNDFAVQYYQNARGIECEFFLVRPGTTEGADMLRSMARGRTFILDGSWTNWGVTYHPDTGVIDGFWMNGEA